MRKIVLFIASSLDGYIARSNGDIDWLFTDQNYGYTKFLDSIDTVLMGRKTYEQVLTFGEYPYQEKKSYVFTKNLDFQATSDVEVVTNLESFVNDLRLLDGKNIWLVGGALQISRMCLRISLRGRCRISPARALAEMLTARRCVAHASRLRLSIP